jgi:protocatechuate 3,4-dioxygenase beta subunit
MASAAVGGLALLGISTDTRADEPGLLARTINRPTTLAPGSIQGVVQDENGAPVDGAVVSALGKTTVYAVTDRNGRFELRALSPGSYVLRAL